MYKDEHDNKTVYGSNIKDGNEFHESNYNDTTAFEYGSKYKEPVEKPKLCVFCNAPWSPRMETIYIESGYCETCWDSCECDAIVCDSCNRIVYRK